MTAVLTDLGKQRAIELFTNDITHIGIGRPSGVWPDEQNPPLASASATGFADLIGYAKVDSRGWLVPDPSTGTIIINGIKYSTSGTPTNIGFVKASIASGVAEGLSNKIGQIGVAGKNVVTNPTNSDWTIPSNITTLGTLFRIENIPVWIKQANTKIDFYIAFPLIA